MYAAALQFRKMLENAAAGQGFASLEGFLASFDLLFVTTLCDIAQLRGLLPPSAKKLPLVAYFHENQLCYPRAQQHEEGRPYNQKRDLHFGMMNISSALAADHVFFNSEFQRSAFLAEISQFLKIFPDKQPKWVSSEIAQKSSILYPGIDAPNVENNAQIKQKAHIPTIVWNHRWEFDKQPEVFFKSLYQIEAEGYDFRLIILGENSQARPKAFEEAKERLAAKILHFGYAAIREQYLELLAQADLTISCAIQENFGIAALESIAAGAWPLLPQRLSYPELIPQALANKVFYSSDEGLLTQLRQHLDGFKEARPFVSPAEKAALAQHLEAFYWPQRSTELAAALRCAMQN